MRRTFLVVVGLEADASAGALDEDASDEVSAGVAVDSAAAVEGELASSVGVLVVALATGSSEAIVGSRGCALVLLVMWRKH